MQPSLRLSAKEVTMADRIADYIYDDGCQVGYVDNGVAFDEQHRARYRVDGDRLLDIMTGEVVGYLTTMGKIAIVSKKGLFG
jgi:hypothetical protein